MREYIVNLTNNLIGKNRYDEIFRRMDNKEEFLTHVKFDLDSDDVRSMTPETLGKIMCAFEIGDVLSAHPGKEVTFSGDCEDLLREIVSICLAYVIRSRLNGESKTLYSRSSFGFAESGFKDIIDGLAGKKKGMQPIQREVPFYTPEQLKAQLVALKSSGTRLTFLGYQMKGLDEYRALFEDKNHNQTRLSKNQCQKVTGINGVLMSEVVARWP